MPHEHPFLVGSYGTPGPYFHAKGEGLTLCALDADTGGLRRIAAVPDAGNVHFLAKHGDTVAAALDRYLAPGAIASFTVPADGGAPRRTGISETAGNITCHVAISPDGRTAFTASYGEAKVGVHPLNDDGVVGPLAQTLAYAGSGPNKERQEASHAHQAAVSPDGKHIYVPDLGSDTVWVHALKDGVAGEPAPVRVTAGSGPRHLAFHPTRPVAYLLCELDAVLRVFRRDPATGLLAEKVALPTLPENFVGTPSAAAIRLHPSGRALVVSNREADTLTVFAADADGNLARAACFDCGGKTPREFDFSPDGRWLVVCHHDGHGLASFEWDSATGLPTGRSGGTLPLGSPVCVLFV